VYNNKQIGAHHFFFFGLLRVQHNLKKKKRRLFVFVNRTKKRVYPLSKHVLYFKEYDNFVKRLNFRPPQAISKNQGITSFCRKL